MAGRQEQDVESKGSDEMTKGATDGRHSPSAKHTENAAKHTNDHGTRREGARENPFEQIEEGGTNYRSLEWWQAGLIMIAETVSIGILSLPSVLDRVGLVPGLILIIGLAAIATYTGYVLWQMKLKYPWIHTYADALEVIGQPIGCGRIFREITGAALVILLTFVMGSHILTWTIALNVITGHPVCTIVWSVVGLVVFWILDLPRTLRSVSWLSIVSCMSILSAVLITMIDVGVDPPNPGAVQATAAAEFATAFNAVSNIIFAYGGHSAYFQFMSEFREIKDYPKALYLLQGVDTILYIVAAVVIYYYSGNMVQSPAIGSASTTVAKVAWGIAIPTILVAGVVYAHVAAKYIYVRIFRGTPHLTAKTFFSYGVWAGITLCLWVVAWVIAESIPSFNNLLSLISALFVSWFTYGFSGMFWLFLNYGQWFSSPKQVMLTTVNTGLILMGFAIMGIGLYASGTSIHQSAGQGASWSCADNSS